MAGLFLDKRYISDTTSVSNYLIDNYMPAANGEFVKIYLHLLRSVTSDNNLSISKIADAFNDTERDVIRALRYWENLGLLTLSKDEKAGITGIRLEPCAKKGVSNAASFSDACPDSDSDSCRYSYSSEEISDYYKDEAVSQMFFLAQTYLARPLSNEDTNTLLYIMNQLGFSPDLIEYLIEYCVSDGHKSISYIEKVAGEWAENGISSVKEAKKTVTMTGSKFYPVLKAFGITGHALAKYQREYIIKWSYKYKFSMDIIVEACNRTMQTIEQPNFNYTDSILEKWHNSNVKTMDDIKKLDLQYEKNKFSANDSASKNKAKSSTKSPAKSCTTAEKPSVKSKGTFHRFSQRTYDFGQLEKQLITNKI